jgi:aspartyl protease family protein
MAHPCLSPTRAAVLRRSLVNRADLRASCRSLKWDEPPLKAVANEVESEPVETPARLILRTPTCLLLLLLCGLVPPLALHADVYKWVDENGTIHYSQDRNTLPKGVVAPESGSNPVEVLKFQKRGESATPSAESYTVRMATVAGGNHIVQVQINGRATVPMMLDTGASDVVITRETAARAGITQHDYRGTQTYSTANGAVTQHAITLREVRVGGAAVKMVRGSISESMEIGLLGAAFLKNFEYSIKGSELVLVPRD